ncbi:MAG: hypothetical protein J5896_02580 [Alphaproteobacteria bacterium]|nr:hypothetical protein [Alphaproteobacteria bacterium]
MVDMEEREDEKTTRLKKVCRLLEKNSSVTKEAIAELKKRKSGMTKKAKPEVKEENSGVTEDVKPEVKEENSGVTEDVKPEVKEENSDVAEDAKPEAKKEDFAITPKVIAEVKELLLVGHSAEERVETYMANIPEYENLIYYAWDVPELLDEAFAFWDDVLNCPEALYTGNSVIRILVGRRPKEQLLQIFQNHRGRFFGDPIFGYVIKTLVLGYLEPETARAKAWTETETNILKNIVQLF